MRLQLSACVLLTLLLPAMGMGDVPSVMSYQGVLTDAGGTPVTDGSYSVLFSIYDVPGGGSALWSETQSVSTTGGAFSIMLGSVTPLTSDYFEGPDRFLGIKIGADSEISPRTELGAVPFAFNGNSGWTDDGSDVHLADNNDKVGIGLASPFAKLGVRSEWSETYAPMGIRSYLTNSNTGGGYAGHFHYEDITGGGNVGYGLYTEAEMNGSAPGIGIRSRATNTGSGNITGGMFDLWPTGAGDATGLDVDVTASGSGSALGGTVHSINTGTGLAQGLTVRADADNNAAIGQHIIVSSATSDADGINLNVTGDGIVDGIELFVESISSAARGVSVNVTSAGSGSGVHSAADVTSSSQSTGVAGYSTNHGSGTSVGVYGSSVAEGSSVSRGLWAWALNSGTGAAYGVFGEAAAGGAANDYGVYGKEAAGGGGAAIYAAGDMNASGTKSAVVRTSQGENLMYAIEAAEIWFEDAGEGRLENGRAHVELDALYLETVTVDADHPMIVFIQLNDECNGTYVKRSTTGFDVYEQQSGTSDAAFTYRVMAKRKGYEDERLRPTTAGHMDVNLYPERAAEIEAALGRPTEQ